MDRYEEKKAEARRRGITVDELALEEHPEIRRIRRRLGIR